MEPRWTVLLASNSLPWPAFVKEVQNATSQPIQGRRLATSTKTKQLMNARAHLCNATQHVRMHASAFDTEVVQEATVRTNSTSLAIRKTHSHALPEPE